MTVWAHADDDLIFAGTQLPRVIGAGGCVRTVFLTDGDAGRGVDYTRGRVDGIRRAYDVVRGAATGWGEQELVLPSGVSVSLHTPVGDTRVSLVFLHLPDGNLGGEGYPATGGSSLTKLAAGSIATLTQSSSGRPLAWGELVGALNDLITGYEPASLYTHVPGAAHSLSEGDHADHAVTGILVRKAWFAAPRGPSAISYAMGYPTQWYPANISGPPLEQKLAVFRAYAVNDPVLKACYDDASCLAVRGFGAWLTREYLYTDAELGLG